ncbi:MAG: putative rane protein [Actinomycetota bacterium]|jgi:putative membrane protein|nr:putative rane protein [Actinomycetota bacterium]
MKSIVVKILVNGVALSFAAYVLKGIHLGQEGATTRAQLVTVLWVALIFGLVNAFIKPVLKFFATPAIILTLGLFTLVLNAAMLELTSYFAGKLNLAFHVDQFFWDAVIGAIIITVVSLVLHLILPGDD